MQGGDFTMLFLLSHIWLLYFLALTLIFIGFFFGLGSFDALLYAAVFELIPVLGLWCIRRGYIIPSVIIAVLCLAILILAVWGFRQAVKACDKKMKASGAIISVIAVISTLLWCFSSNGQILQTILAVSCLFGMLSVVYILLWLSQFGKGMSH